MKHGSRRILIMAGGTGGHVFPALAVARYLQEQGIEIIWLGTRRGMESQLVPQAGFNIRFISVSGLRGKKWPGLLLAPFKLFYALAQALIICLRLKPDAVLGMGGFVTGPGGLAAWLLRRPLLIHEQNAIPGLTNRLLSYLALQVMEAFPDSFGKHRALHTGNPIRREIVALDEPAKRFATHGGAIRILVIGGSLGAQSLNETVPAAIAQLAADIPVAIQHQAGREKLEATQDAYNRAGVKAQITMFIDDMAAALGWADLVICRAGALTVSELAAAGVGSVLVPYPYAVDDHQTANAAYLQRADAARVISAANFTGEQLASVLRELLEQGREKLLSMAQQARQQAMPDATRLVGQHCLEVMHV
ncbi:undecaprenyldiphospho-muramoylpentapeptide beta-N-acetylglucosaminyltransferase [Thiohalophilus sp.]|uniref:undecaprenyldiphospho-muramoylpentapeptide beta-N-acetylglucosaminyltransferase n=1 Tax=Thiohalophilus sp. TaxID=3028392 RepID=UPI0039758416